VNKPITNQLLLEQPDNEIHIISIAFGLSLALHYIVLHALPWLEAVKAKPPISITAELQVLAPSVPPPVETKSAEQTSKPAVEKVEKPKKLLPVLASQAESAPKEYEVADTHQPSQIANVQAPTVIHESNPTPSTTETITPSPKNAPTSTPSTVSDEVSAEEAWDGYGQSLYELVGKNKNYPQMAIRRNWEGEVKVMAKFVLGKLIEIILVSTSGHKVLDDEALEMVRKSVGILPIKGNLSKKTFTVTVPVNFKLGE
jgi:protein TonB